MKSILRDGTMVETYDGEGKVIAFLYGHSLGRAILSVFIRPGISHLAGRFLDSRISRFLVAPFVKKNKLDLSDYPERSYKSFNDFFTRQITEGKRPIDPEQSHLIAPCDGKLTLFALEEDAHFMIKGCDYTLETLLRSKKLSERYKGGWGILLRLSVDDYHRYIYPVAGKKTKNYRIPGVYHTVNPRAAAVRQIYQENTREFTVIRSENFGPVLMMEIGAMMVGRISNHHGSCMVSRGEEKGNFEFGGSSIMLLMVPGTCQPDEDLIRNSAQGLETVVKQGEKIGRAQIAN